MKINYSPESIDDLKRLREFIEIKNPVAAARVSNDLLSGIAKLKIFPQMGLPVSRAPNPELIRDLFIGSYTIRYLLTDSDIFILRIWHNKENEKNL